MKIIGALVVVGVVGCADNVAEVEQLVGPENCAPIVVAGATGATVSISLDNGFNAWKNQNAPSVTLAGNATTCSGTLPFTATMSGSWTFAPGNQACSTDYYGTADLSAAANHWHNIIHCDGSVEVAGCQSDVSYTAALFLDGPGANDFSTAVTGSIGAVQDADEIDACGECPIGACVSACQASCPQGDTDCGQCCECWCKEEGREGGNEACQPQNLCYTGSPGHAVCLSSQL